MKIIIIFLICCFCIFLIAALLCFAVSALHIPDLNAKDLYANAKQSPSNGFSYIFSSQESKKWAKRGGCLCVMGVGVLLFLLFIFLMLCTIK